MLYSEQEDILIHNNNEVLSVWDVSTLEYHENILKAENDITHFEVI